MTTTLTPRSRLRELNDLIRRVDRESAGLEADREARLAELRRDGINSASPGSELADELTRRAREIDDLKDRRLALRDEARRLLEQLPAGGGSGGSGFPLGFGPDELESLRASVMRRQGGTIGFGSGTFASIAPGDFPMAEHIDYRLDSVWPFLRDATRIADLFPTEATDARTVTVYRATTTASAAAPVAEGAAKPVSSPAWEPVEITIETLAHVSSLTVQMASDYPSWRDAVGQEMIGGLLDAENSQMISGDGATPNLLGILSTPSIGSVTRDTTNERRVEAIHRGLTSVRTSGKAEPDAIVIHPNDLQDVRLETSPVEGFYLAGDPLTAEPNSLWGVRLVVTEHVPEGTSIIGSFASAGRVYLRQAATLEANPYSDEAWSKNLIDLRAEERIALAIVRPQQLCEVLLV